MIHISDPLVGLYWFAGLLSVGIILTIIAKKIKVPEILLILLLGVFIGNFTSINVDKVIPVPILIGFSIFTLIMIIFESSSKFKLGEIAKISPTATKLSVLFIGFCVIFLTSVVHLLFFYGKFSWKDLLVSLLFATLMGATDPDIMLSLIKNTKNKLLEVLGFESIINTPLTVIIPLMILEIYQGVIRNNYIIHLLQQIMTGVGTGLVLGLIIFRLSYKKFYINIGPLVVIATALVTYALAEGINGNGVLAVTTLGIVYGRLNIKDKLSLSKFTDSFTVFLRIIAFILVGLLIKLPHDKNLLMKSLLVFLIYILIRYLAVRTSFLKNPINFREKLFMSLNIPKGITVVVVTFILFGYNIAGFNRITPLIYLFILYSIFLGSIVTIFANKFVDLKDGSNGFLRKKNVIK